MNIGLIDEDETRFPNLALMKLSKYHKSKGDLVSWWSPFENYDIVYMSKVFNFSRGFDGFVDNAEKVIKCGTGHDIKSELPREVDSLQPDYTIYPYIKEREAFGFLTRGCPNRCKWCVVPEKEGFIKTYSDIEDITQGKRDRVVLMDNNILAAGDFAVGQLKKIVDKNIRIDFNQAMDARLVDDYFAGLLARVKWLKYIRFGCDTHAQIAECERAMDLITKHGYKGEFFLYTIIQGDIKECVERVGRWKNCKHKVTAHAQPFLDPHGKTTPPQWQKDLTRWANRKWLYKSCDFKDYEPRKDFRCIQYLK